MDEMDEAIRRAGMKIPILVIRNSEGRLTASLPAIDFFGLLADYEYMMRGGEF